MQEERAERRENGVKEENSKILDLKYKNSEIIETILKKKKKMLKSYTGEKNNTNNEEDHSGICLSRT